VNAPAPSPQAEPDPATALEAEVHEAIATRGGDARAAVRVLLVANAHLEQENKRLQQAVSAGFSRGKIRRRQKPEEPDQQLDL
jgi:hypothetical protein